MSGTRIESSIYSDRPGRDHSESGLKIFRKQITRVLRACESHSNHMGY